MRGNAVRFYHVIGWGAADSVHVKHNHKATRVLTLESRLAMFGSRRWYGPGARDRTMHTVIGINQRHHRYRRVFTSSLHIVVSSTLFV